MTAGKASTAEPQRFDLGREFSEDGRFVRQTSAFRRWVTADGSSGFPAAAGRYHLYASLACPWSQRSVIGRLLKGLEDAISISYVNPYRDARGWEFTGGEFVDPVNGFRFLSEAYAATDPSFDERFSLPVLWDKETSQIVSNESGEILRMLGTAFDAFAEHDVDLYPEPLRAEIDALDDLIYENVNNGVYEAGFSPSRPSSGSTPSTTSTSSATCGGLSTTRISGVTRATCTSYPGSPRPWTWIRSSATTSRRTT